MLDFLAILLVGLFAIYRLTQTPITLNVTVNAKEPETDAETETETDVPDLELSSDIKAYIALESDEWARGTRTRRAKRLLAKLNNQEMVLKELKREDYVE